MGEFPGQRVFASAAADDEQVHGVGRSSWSGQWLSASTACAAVFPAERLRDGGRDVAFRLRDGGRQVQPVRQPRRDRRRVRAAGAVRRDAARERRAEFVRLAARQAEQVDGLLACEVAALHQKRHAVPRAEFGSGGRASPATVSMAPTAEQHARFVEVRRHERGAAGKGIRSTAATASGSSNSSPLLATITGSTTSGGCPGAGADLRDGLDHLAGVQHPGFDRRHGKRFSSAFDLLAHDLRRHAAGWR